MNPPRRVDESMDLLTDIVRQPIDPDYPEPGAGTAPRRSPAVIVVLLVFGLMAGVSLASTLRAAPQLQQERAELQARVEAADAQTEALRLEVAELTQANRELTEAGADLDPETQAELSQLEATTGARAVTGPGVIARVDDGEGGDQAQIVAADLLQLVNQFWRSGAEAIAINGHRLSSRTAIRGAGAAITVDYRSLTRPYQVEAIGDPDRLLADFPDSAGGQWWAYLQQNYLVAFELRRADELTLAADPELQLDRAETAR